MPQKSPKGTVRPPVLDAPTGCLHEDAVPVTLQLTGERVAQLCLACDAQLAAEWIPAARQRLLALANHDAPEVFSSPCTGHHGRDCPTCLAIRQRATGLPETGSHAWQVWQDHGFADEAVALEYYRRGFTPWHARAYVGR